MGCTSKGSDRILHISSLFSQVLGHLKDLDKRFSRGASGAVSGAAFKAVFTVDL